MKSTGIVRKIELRRTLGIDAKDSVEIYVDQDAIILKKFKKSCIFCGGGDNHVEYKDKLICPDCLNSLKK